MPAIGSPIPLYLLQRQSATQVFERRRSDCQVSATQMLNRMARRCEKDQTVLVLLLGREISYEQLRYGCAGWAVQ
jgi:hypothetical protein